MKNNKKEKLKLHKANVIGSCENCKQKDETIKYLTKRLESEISSRERREQEDEDNCAWGKDTCG